MIEIDYTLLTDLVLDRLLTEHVLREGTDYGEVEFPFEDKKQQLLQCLRLGKCKIVFDFELRDSGLGISDAERAELQRLRKEVKQLRMETEILKKASAYFAKEMK